MKKIERKFLMCMILFSCSLFSEAQGVPKIDLPRNASPDFSVVEFNPANHPLFNKVFEQKPEMSSVRTAAFVISNESDRPIVGVAVRWILSDADGKEMQIPSFTHCYLSSDSAPLISPHTKMLIAPGAFIPETAMQSQGFIGSMPSPATVTRFRSSSKLRVEIDSIIFSDGEVIGGKSTELIRDIEDRRIAADLVIRHVQNANLQGRDPRDALRELESVPLAWSRHVALYRSIFIHQLIGTSHFDSVLRDLHIPQPPKFFKKDGSAL